MNRLSSVWPEVNFPFTLAPMVGLSHVALREVVRDYIPKNAKTFWPTEMLNSRRLPQQRIGETPETRISDRDEMLVPQILGNNERHIRLSIEKLEAINIRGVDINMGCPVQKALKHNYGVALMGDPEYAAEVVSMANRSGPHPVTVKLRVGLSKDHDYFYRFCDGLVDSGAKLLTLHPRTAEQKRRGNADWDQIRLLRERVSVPVVGNGDIQTFKDALRMLEETQCDSVMMGRALTVRPWIFWQLGEVLGFEPPIGKEGQRAPQTEEEEAKEYGKVIEAFIINCFEYFPPEYATRKLKFFLKVSSPWLNFGLAFIKRINKGSNPEEYIQITQEFFLNDSLRLSPYTSLSY
ncbi:MAG: tRNA-dihydrouridine synthase family protein [Halobacteriovoraceae bacterium]|nr:tRNA-dihydrouridine synthase family protein [Halobacteriovoraceae bacterium]